MESLIEDLETIAREAQQLADMARKKRDWLTHQKALQIGGTAKNALDKARRWSVVTAIYGDE